MLARSFILGEGKEKKFPPAAGAAGDFSLHLSHLHTFFQVFSTFFTFFFVNHSTKGTIFKNSIIVYVLFLSLAFSLLPVKCEIYHLLISLMHFSRKMVL